MRQRRACWRAKFPGGLTSDFPPTAISHCRGQTANRQSARTLNRFVWGRCAMAKAVLFALVVVAAAVSAAGAQSCGSACGNNGCAVGSTSCPCVLLAWFGLAKPARAPAPRAISPLKTKSRALLWCGGRALRCCHCVNHSGNARPQLSSTAYTDLNACAACTPGRTARPACQRAATAAGQPADATGVAQAPAAVAHPAPAAIQAPRAAFPLRPQTSQG